MNLERLLEIAAEREMCSLCTDGSDETCFSCTKAKGIPYAELIEYFAQIKTVLRRTAEDDKAREEGPEIVCLCGSTRFYDAFQRANYELTMAGKIVLSVGFYCHSQEQAHGETVDYTAEQKVALDELHRRKIDLCDRVLVLNVGGYIGGSTRSEIAYAETYGKPVDYLEPLTHQAAEAALGGGEGG